MTSEDTRGRPAWFDSLGVVAVLVAAAAMWAYFAVAAFANAAYLLAALDVLLLVSSVWTVTRILGRRRRRTG